MKQTNLHNWKFGEKRLGMKNRIIPERYVWHVSNSFQEWKLTFRNEGMDYAYFKTHYVPELRKKIAVEGLRFKNCNAVFAHHGTLHPVQMHPIWLDVHFDHHYRYSRSAGDYRFLQDYTFWRIDTRSLDIPWYVDPYMGESDRSKIEGFPPQNKYILTPNEIPPTAITCFAYRISRKKSLREYHPNLPKERHENPWDFIRPVYEINQLIYHAAVQAA